MPFACDYIIEKGYFNICLNILNQAAIDYRSGDKELKNDVISFVNSSWFGTICSHYELNPDLWRTMILDTSCPVKNKLIITGL